MQLQVGGPDKATMISMSTALEYDSRLVVPDSLVEGTILG